MKAISARSMEGFELCALALRARNRQETMLRQASEAMDWALDRLRSGELCQRFDGNENCVCSACMFKTAVERILVLEDALSGLLDNSQQTFDPDDVEMKTNGVTIYDGHIAEPKFYEAWLRAVELIAEPFPKASSDFIAKVKRNQQNG